MTRRIPTPAPPAPAAAAASPAPGATPSGVLGDRMADRVRDKILQGGFAPGQRLSETALAAELGVSRNTLREVFRTLTQEGLLTHEPNRGVFVAEPSIAAIIDIYRVRRLIECQAMSQAYPRHPAGRSMRESVLAAQASQSAADWQAVGTANMAFHRAIVELADSVRLNALFGHVLVELRLAFGLLGDAESLHAPFLPMNRNILDLYEAGRFDQAAAALGEYLAQSERVVLAVFARRDVGA